MSKYYILTRPFGRGSRVEVSGTNLTIKGAVKKFKALGYNVTEEDVKTAPYGRPLINFDMHIPTYSQQMLDDAKKGIRPYPMPFEAKAWNTNVNDAARTAEKVATILQAADIDCKLYYTSIDVYEDTNSPDGLEFASIVVETLRAPKKELK